MIIEQKAIFRYLSTIRSKTTRVLDVVREQPEQMRLVQNAVDTANSTLGQGFQRIHQVIEKLVEQLLLQSTGQRQDAHLARADIGSVDEKISQILHLFSEDKRERELGYRLVRIDDYELVSIYIR